MRLRCDSTHRHHSCSLPLDWLGTHAGDHCAHEGHDLGRPVLATWPNDGAASRGIPVRSTAAVSGAASRTAAPAVARRADPPADTVRHTAPPRPRGRYEEDITEWDLLPDA